ncbi:MULTISPECIES: RNA-guided endonuclease TnpB family protein [Streptomyces]|uniref:Transposase n=1 Tax=Streptomyces koelreuteriae TaxID=2838015 RepID=A0ABX8FSR3_9ACTN|nr:MULTISPECIES: RNA-guided endonuclease TnpB family protein [Streptomyces]QWB24131.1 transposase [Streptomyces koelreuteriae]UUA07118.1 RNA-guided endonuclease TnpB family protein [Streptomyces koelreuteriae]UUA14747.1 RNA-guided endonuclease TnpB family protein [Streptomyces sp. CRCS-T-1]
MQLVVQVKLLPTPEQASALTATLRACNQAATHAAAIAHAKNLTDRNGLQQEVYAELKAVFGLSAQPAVRVVKKVVDAYTTLKANLRAGNLGRPGSKRRIKAESKPVTFRPRAAQPFDDRCLSWQLDQQTVSVWTTAGRLKKVRFACSPETLKLLAAHRRGESDLIERDGTFYLMATCDVPEAGPYEPEYFVGVDLRAKLQKKRTKSARRRLKERRRREQRHVKNTNHIIAKRIVTEAQRTSAGIALEDLGGIRHRARLRKPQRVTLHSWAFAQLGEFIAYKAHRQGVPVVHVDPAHTSQTCCECGYIDKRNRVDQALFVCRNCGVVAHADRNASHNIAHRGAVVWNAGRESRVPAAP